jgi:hypothetical protein
MGANQRPGGFFDWMIIVTYVLLYRVATASRSAIVSRGQDRCSNTLPKRPTLYTSCGRIFHRFFRDRDGRGARGCIRNLPDLWCALAQIRPIRRCVSKAVCTSTIGAVDHAGAAGMFDPWDRFLFLDARVLDLNTERRKAWGHTGLLISGLVPLGW